jgi:hypothetical protein
MTERTVVEVKGGKRVVDMRALEGRRAGAGPIESIIRGLKG